MIALRIFDPRETSLPDVGMIPMKDAETGNLVWVDSANRRVREKYNQYWHEQSRITHDLFDKHGIDYADISTAEDYVKPLMLLFKKRA